MDEKSRTGGFDQRFLKGFDDLQRALCVEQVFLRERGLGIFIQHQRRRQTIKLTGNLELLNAFGQAEAVHVAFIGLDVAALEEDRQGFEDGRFAIVIAATMPVMASSMGITVVVR